MKLWGSRLQKKTDSLMERLNASIGFDRRLWAADIRGSMAYAQALERAGLVTTEERDELLRALERGVPLRELPLDEFREVAEEFGEDVYRVFDFRRSVEARDSYGGTATQAVRQQLAKAREKLG
jgi:argininosuccinate lyase